MFLTRSRMLRGVGGALVLACLLVSAPYGQAQVSRLDLPPPADETMPAEPCGTEVDRAVSLGLAQPLELADGQGLMFDQTPAIIRPDMTGNLTLRVQLVGDFGTLQFERSDPDVDPDPVETWTRTTTRTVSGRIVSIFEKSYPDSEVARILRRRRWGFDYGALYWGWVRLPNSETKRAMLLRIGSTNTPTATVVRLGSDVQYGSHVVNLRIPDFGDTRVATGDHGFDLQGAARKFFEYFPDSYDMIAFVPQSAALAGYGAFHRSVKNEVSGIGDRIFDNSAGYGSAGTLMGVEVDPQSAFTSHEASNHEITHQWGDYLDLTGLAGVEPKGHQPEGHTPLMTGGPTLIGAVLYATRYVVAAADGSYEIRQSPYPILQHPLELYVMGKITAEALGTQRVFENQGQFDAESAATPNVGTKVAGGVKEVTVGAILGRHGNRSGPSPSVIRRATVLISRDALASQAEMDYWNYHAQRLGDPNRTGVPSYEGYVSYDRATNNSVDLRTEVSPKSGPAAGGPADVTTTRFGRTDWRAVQFDDTVPSRFAAGQTIRLSGRITETDRTDYNSLAVRFWKYGGNSGNAVLHYGTVTRSLTFTVDVSFTAAQRGLYGMEVFLFWPGLSAGSARGMVSPVLVE